MKEENRLTIVDKGGVYPRRRIYCKIAKHTDEIISTLYHLMMGATQESVRVAAANKVSRSHRQSQ